MEKAIKTEKKIECIIGIFFLIPPILGVLSFLSCLVEMAYGDYGAGAGCSSSPGSLSSSSQATLRVNNPMRQAAMPIHLLHRGVSV